MQEAPKQPEPAAEEKPSLKKAKPEKKQNNANSEIAQLQAMLIMKEKEIGDWQKSFDKQELKCQALEKE